VSRLGLLFGLKEVVVCSFLSAVRDSSGKNTFIAVVIRFLGSVI